MWSYFASRIFQTKHSVVTKLESRDSQQLRVHILLIVICFLKTLLPHQ